METGKLKNPFILWESYTSANREFFFGRDEDILSLRQALSKNHVVFYGPSGAGKTSICRAGLSPDIYIEDYTTDYLKEKLGIEENSYAGLDKLISDTAKPLIILDQFEKVFYDNDRNIDFIEYLIERYVRSNIARIIITIREENIGDLFRFSSEHNFSLLSDKTGFYLRKMERSSTIDILKRIFEKCGIKINQESISLIVDTIQSATGTIELADIQAVGYELFEQLSEDQSQLSTERVFNIIDGFYTRLYESLSDDEKFVLKKGISSSGERTKIPQFLNNEKPLISLISRRILKKVGDYFEIVHDYLLKKILDRLTSEELSIIRIEELIFRAYKDYEFNHSLLIDALRLNDINKFRESITLSYGECELVTRSTLINDLSPSSRYYWLMRMSGFFPQSKKFFLSILREGIMENSFSDSINQIMTVRAIKEVFSAHLISNSDFYEINTLALLSRNKEVLFAGLKALPEITQKVIPHILNSLINSQYYCKPEIYTLIHSLPGSGLIVQSLKEWAVSSDPEKIRTAYEYYKKNKILPETLHLEEPDENNPSFIIHQSYLAASGEVNYHLLEPIVKILFSFDGNLTEYALLKIREKNLVNDIFSFIAKKIEPPFESLFKNQQDFLDYEAFIHKKRLNISFFAAGVIEFKCFPGFTLISFADSKPVFRLEEKELVVLLKKSVLNSRYVIDYSRLDLSSADITINIIRAISALGEGISIYSACISSALKKKLERFGDFAQSLSVNWVI